MKAMAIDLGNGFVKAISEQRSIVAPSSFAYEYMLGDNALDILEDGNENQGYATFSSHLDQEEAFVWGPSIKSIVSHDQLQTSYTGKGRYKSQNFRLMAQFILAELASDFGDHVDTVLTVTLPSDEVRSGEGETVKNFFSGKHLVSRNGIEIMIHVKAVKVQEQPLGTLLNIYMNEDFQVHKELMQKTIAVIDFGAGTSIIDTYRNMRRLPDQSLTMSKGQIDIYKSIAAELSEEQGTKIAYSYVEEGFSNQTYAVKISERAIFPFDHLVDRAIKRFTQQILTDINAQLTDRTTIDMFVLTGGGVNIVGDKFQELFQESMAIAEDPQQANALGAFKLAKALRAQWQQNEETSQT